MLAVGIARLAQAAEAGLVRETDETLARLGGLL